MSGGPDAATLLERAMLDHAAAAGCAVTVVHSESTRWSSATFTGARHLLTVVADASPAFDAWISALPDAELRLRGHMVADCVVVRISKDARVTVALEILTLEER